MSAALPKHVVLHLPTKSFLCTHCGVSEPTRLPARVKDVLARCRAFCSKHLTCKPKEPKEPKP